MKIYLIVGYTGDIYERFEVYGVATSEKKANELKTKALKETDNGYKIYEEVEIEKIEPNKPSRLNL